MSESKREFKARIEAALKDAQLRSSLKRFTCSWHSSRAQAFGEMDFASLQKELGCLRKEALQDLPQLKEQFIQMAQRRGAHIFEAATAEEANAYILDLAKKQGVRLAVNSKSMATEEIGLNHYLAAEGIQVVETDLGEWILQLSGQRPTHLVLPAIHLSREEVAHIFSATLGREIPSHIGELVATARKKLRQAFLGAQMGISGANLAIAETGTLVLLTNEGNGRLVTSLPPLHVALLGYEKLTPHLKDLALVLKMLPRSATAQKMTSYLSLISGPSSFLAPAGSSLAKELHIVLLDNGRLQMAQDPCFQEVLTCIRCAACLNICPVYQLVGGQVFGHTYMGAIGLLLTAFLEGLQEARWPQELCLGCGQCKEVCPVGLDIPQLILALRERLVEEEGLSRAKALLLHHLLPHRPRFHRLLHTASVLQRPFENSEGYLHHLPPPLSRLTSWRSLPTLAQLPFRDRVGSLPQVSQKAKTRAAFYSGCLIDFLYPEIGEALYKVLHLRGIELIFPPEQSCCGLPALYLGDKRTASHLARLNIRALEETQANYIITACPTCGMALKKKFALLLSDRPDWQTRAQALAAKTYDFSQFLVQVVGVEPPVPASSQGTRAAAPLKVTYHGPCHLKRSLGIFVQPRILLEQVGLELVEMDRSDDCCGFAGFYSLSYPKISEALLKRKLEDVEATGASLLATDCPGCILQLRGGLDKRKSQIQVRHTAEILAERLHFQPDFDTF